MKLVDKMRQDEADLIRGSRVESREMGYCNMGKYPSIPYKRKGDKREKRGKCIEGSTLGSLFDPVQTQSDNHVLTAEPALTLLASWVWQLRRGRVSYLDFSLRRQAGSLKKPTISLFGIIKSHPFPFMHAPVHGSFVC